MEFSGRSSAHLSFPRGGGREQDVLQGHLWACVVHELGCEAFALQVADSALVHEQLAETTDPSTLLWRQHPGSRTRYSQTRAITLYPEQSRKSITIMMTKCYRICNTAQE